MSHRELVDPIHVGRRPQHVGHEHASDVRPFSEDVLEGLRIELEIPVDPSEVRTASFVEKCVHGGHEAEG